MFTGIVEEVGTVRAMKVGPRVATLEIDASVTVDGTDLGGSIAVNGVCLTVVERRPAGFVFEVGPETLSRTALARLAAGQSDLDVLAELLPPDRFAFRGFAHLRAMDMTDPEILSSLKRDLIEKESIVSPERFRRLQESLQALFRQPDLRLGVAALHGEQVFLLNYGARMENQCIFADTVHKRQEDFRGSVYERAVTQGHPLIVDDLASYPGRSAVEDKVLAAGTHSLIVAPLHYQDRVIGTLRRRGDTRRFARRR